MGKNFTIQKILGVLLHRLPLIIISGALMGLMFFLYTSIFVDPVYSAQAMIYVQNYGKGEKNAKVTDDPDASAVTAATAATAATKPTEAKKNNSSESDSMQSNNEAAQKIFASDIAASSTLAKNCIIVFQNSKDIAPFYDDSSLAFATVDDSFYIKITSTGKNPAHCAATANKAVEDCTKLFGETFAYGYVKEVYTATEPQAPISPNKTRSAVIGGIIGIVIACVISILLELIDTTIKHDDDLSGMYKVPVFAEIPDFESSGR